MTETDRPGSRPDPPSPSRRPNPWPSRLIPAGTFLVGLLLGGAVVGAAVGGDDGASSAGEATTSADPTVAPTAGSSSSGSTVVTVPAACQEAGANMREAFSLLRGATRSVEQFRPDRIVSLLNRLEDLDNRTRPLLDRCSQVDVSQSPAPTATGATGTGTASP